MKKRNRKTNDVVGSQMPQDNLPMAGRVKNDKGKSPRSPRNGKPVHIKTPKAK